MAEHAAVWPVNASIFTRLKIGYAALKILEHAPDDPVQGPLFEYCLDSASHRTLVKELKASPVGQRLLAERPTMQGPDLDLAALGKLPEGTFGHELARYFKDNGIGPFLTTFPVDNDEVFMAKRYRETHDLLHVLTGYATHMLGEMELQAFVWGNLGLPSAAMIVMYSLPLRMKICGFKEMGAYFRRLRLAFKRGKASRNLMNVEFEKHWSRTVADVANELIAPAVEVPVITLGIHQQHKMPSPSP